MVYDKNSGGTHGSKPKKTPYSPSDLTQFYLDNDPRTNHSRPTRGYLDDPRMPHPDSQDDLIQEVISAALGHPNRGPITGVGKNPMNGGKTPVAVSGNSNVANLFQEALQGTVLGIAGHIKKAAKDAANGPRPSGVAKLRSRAANGKRFSRPKQVGDNLTDYLEDYLAKKMASNGAEFDYETALRESEKAIRQAYKTDINAIRGSSKAARKQTARDRAELEEMYNALARSYAKQGEESIAQGQQLADMMQSISSEAQQNIQGTANQIQNEQADLFQGLGIEDALSAVAPEQAQDLQNELTETIQTGADAANTQLGFAGNNQRFFERGGQTAKLEGTNRSADLLEDLQDYLQGNRTAIASLKSGRGREVAANKSDIMNSVSEAQAAADAALWDQLMDYSGLKLDIEDTQADNDLNAQKLLNQIRNGNRDARQWAAEFGLDKWIAKHDAQIDRAKLRDSQSSGAADDMTPKWMQQYANSINHMGPQLQDLMATVVDSPKFLNNVYKDEQSGRESPINPSSAAHIAEQIARENGITDPHKIAKIRQAAMLYAQGGV